MLVLLLATLAFVANAQTHTIGALFPGAKARYDDHLASLREGLREEGFIEGKNLRIEYRFADGDHHKLNRLAAELVRAKVAVIYAPSTWPVHAAMEATRTLPIVFSGVNDPVAVNFVESLSRPGRNVTGVSIASSELTAKRLELLKELFPLAHRVGIVYSEYASKACQRELKDIEEASAKLKLNVSRFSYDGEKNLADAFARAGRAKSEVILVPTSYEYNELGGKAFSAISAQSRIPSIHPAVEAVMNGELISYGPDNHWAYRRAGNYVGRVLKGAKAADLPVERPKHYELAVNLKTAKAMGVRIPPSILLRATRVIE